MRKTINILLWTGSNTVNNRHPAFAWRGIRHFHLPRQKKSYLPPSRSRPRSYSWPGGSGIGVGAREMSPKKRKLAKRSPPPHHCYYYYYYHHFLFVPNRDANINLTRHQNMTDWDHVALQFSNYFGGVRKSHRQIRPRTSRWLYVPASWCAW